MTDNIVSVKPDPLQGKEDHIGVGSGKTNKSERLDRHSGEQTAALTIVTAPEPAACLDYRRGSADASTAAAAAVQCSRCIKHVVVSMRERAEVGRHAGTGRTGAAKKHGSGKGGWGRCVQLLHHARTTAIPQLSICFLASVHPLHATRDAQTFWLDHNTAW